MLACLISCYVTESESMVESGCVRARVHNKYYINMYDIAIIHFDRLQNVNYNRNDMWRYMIVCRC